MNITRENVDALNAVVKVDIEKEDYSDKVENTLKNYRKTANIPGFRKGRVPMGMLKKQYGKAVLVDEVNKLLQDALNKYLIEEKLDVLGQPLPKSQDNIDWNGDAFSFEFELGLAPQFDINLKGEKEITHYHIIADDKMIDDKIKYIQKQYSSLIPQETVENDSEITGTFVNEERGIESTVRVTLDKFKDEATAKQFEGAKVNDAIVLKTKGLYNHQHDLMNALKLYDDEVNDLDIEVTFTITEINKRVLADLDQDLFDKLYEEDAVKTVTELKTKIKEEAEELYKKQSDQVLLDDVTEYLIEHTKFDLPEEFLTKWMQTAGEKEIDLDQAKEEYNNSEKTLRYKLIETKLIEDNNIKITGNDIENHSKNIIKKQMAQFGVLPPSDEKLDSIVERMLSNQEETRRISEQLINEKLLQLYKEKANLKTKELSYEKFVEEVYGDK